MADSELEKTSGYYRGNEFTRKTNTGKDQYKVMFSPSMESDKRFSFKCFNTTKGFDLLKPGELYDIGFVTDEPYTNRAGVTVSNSKTAMFFGEHSEDSNTTTETNTNSDMGSWISEYKSKIRETGNTLDLAHALGSYLLQNKRSAKTVREFESSWNNTQ